MPASPKPLRRRVKFGRITAMDSIKKLQDLFSRFPTIGKRTAGRFVFYLIRQPKESVDELISALQELKKSIKLCSDCFNPFEGEESLCDICRSTLREKHMLCIVEKESDLLAIETTKRYKGLYFILGGVVSAFKPDGSGLRFEALKKRVSGSQFTEIIIALNPTPEGRATSVLVERELKDLSHNKVTHLAQGLPVGGELEYADEETLESAFEGRK